MTVLNQKTEPPSSIAIWTAMVSVYLLWGSTYLAIRIGIETIPPFMMAATRFLIAGGILYAIRRVMGDGRPSRSEWRPAAVIGILLLVGGNGGVVWAEQRVASGIAALLVGTAPLWMILIESLHPGGRKPNRWAMFGIFLGFVGITLLIGPPQVTGHGEEIDIIGAFVLIFATLSWAIGSLYSRQAKLPSSPLLGTAMEMLAGGGALLLLSFLAGEFSRLNLAHISLRSLGAMVYLIIFGSWIGLTCYTWLLRVAPTPLVFTYAYVNPVVAVLLGHLLASEPLTVHILIAATIVIGSVALTTVSQQASLRRRTSGAELESPVKK
jgi:drug/metabolite transporter (DMT)-like permease